MWISTLSTRTVDRPGPAAGRRRLWNAFWTLMALAMLARDCPAQDWLDQLEDDLSLKSQSGYFRSDLSVALDVEGYYVDQRPPGLLYDDESFINPRATFFVDSMAGDHFYGFLQARVDRGFDPGRRNGGQARLDEYLLRWKPLDNPALNVQFGKSATVIGNWVSRHDTWNNPLITPPLPYENLMTISDDEPPVSPAAFLARRNLPDDKDGWLPVVWGPAYTTGWSLFGTIARFDYAFEIKNASISSHPDQWDVNNSYWQHPTYSGRIGFRPDAAWNHGVSFSFGPYMYANAQPLLPPGKTINDFNEIVLDYDISYAWHHWEWWGEVFLTRFEVPNVGNADVLTYYLETKYKITSSLYAAARWNQQLFGTVPDGTGGQTSWDANVVQVDLALGYRFNRHWQAKVQYSYSHRNASPQQGEQLVATQVTLKF